MGASRKRKRRSNGGDTSHSSPAKRRRSSNSAKNPFKPVLNESSTVVDQSAEDTAQLSSTESKEKRKHRPRCHKICFEAVDKITKALRSSPSPIGHLFKNADSDGMPCALLSEIVPILSLSDRLLTLPRSKLPLLNGKEHVFQMDLDASGQFIVKYAPIDFDVESATVYLDRLPYPCSLRLLEKLCTKYGTVVDIRIPIRTPAPLKTARSTTVVNRRGTQHRGFAFVQFACRQDAEAMCQEFALNHPTALHSRNRWFFNRGRRVHLGPHTTKLAALRELRHGRMLRLKLRLEKDLRRRLRVRQWRREWRERRRKLNQARRKKRKERDQLRKEGKLPEKKKKKSKKEKNGKKILPETPKKSKQEKKREANKRKRKRISDLRKEAKLVLAGSVGGGGGGGGEVTESGSESGMEQSSEGEGAVSLNGTPEKWKGEKDGVSDSSPARTKKEKKRSSMNGRKREEESKRAEGDAKKKRRRRCRRKEIRRSVRTHFIDVQALPFREYESMRAEYLRLRKEAEEREEEEMQGFRAGNSNHKREEFRDANWSTKTGRDEE